MGDFYYTNAVKIALESSQFGATIQIQELQLVINTAQKQAQFF